MDKLKIKKNKDVIKIGDKNIDLSIFRRKYPTDSYYYSNLIEFMSSKNKIYKTRCFEMFKKISKLFSSVDNKITMIGEKFAYFIVDGKGYSKFSEYIEKLRSYKCPISEDERFSFELAKIQSELAHLFNIPYVNICIDNYIENTFDIYIDSIKDQTDITHFDGLITLSNTSDKFDDHLKIFADNTNVSITIIVNYEKIFSKILSKYTNSKYDDNKMIDGYTNEIGIDFFTSFIAAILREEYRVHYTEQFALLCNLLSKTDEYGFTQINTLKSETEWKKETTEKYGKILNDLFKSNFVEYEITSEYAKEKESVKSSISKDIFASGIMDFCYNQDPREILIVLEPTAPCISEVLNCNIKETSIFNSPNSSSLLKNDSRYLDSPTVIIKNTLFICRIIPILYYKVYCENNGKNYIEINKLMKYFREYLSEAIMKLSERSGFTSGVVTYISNTIKFVDELDKKFKNPMLTSESIVYIFKRIILQYKSGNVKVTINGEEKEVVNE